jgi:hypothetical protein
MLSPCMKQVSLSSIYAVDKLKGVARDISDHQNWFYDLVDAIGVRFYGINRDTSASVNFSKLIKDDRAELERVFLDKMSNFVLEEDTMWSIMSMFNGEAEDDANDDE